MLDCDTEISVLLVEDSETDAALIADILDQAPRHRFTSTRTGTLREALNLMLDRSFDVALLDLGLPDASGLTGVQRMRRMTPELPIVILTGNEDEALALEAIEQGVQDYLVKDMALDVESILLRTVAFVVERSKLMRTLMRQKRLESLGVFAGSLAHDFNNLITPIIGYTALVLAKLPPDSPFSESLQKALTAAERARDLTRRLLTFGGYAKGVPEVFNINELIVETCELLQRTAGKETRLEVHPLNRPILVNADRVQIQQGLSNLVVNAIQAIGEDTGKIDVSSDVVDITDRLSEHYAGFPPSVPGEYACIEVADNGCGIAPELLGKIFEPLFTTKDQGTGLGLAGTLEIIRSHGGTIFVKSDPGVGTTFKMLLPLALPDA